MDFKLNEEQEMLKNSARDFLKKKVNKDVIKDLSESETGFDKKLWKAMVNLDWPAIIIPENYNGIGWSLLELTVLFEEFGRAAFNGPMLANLSGTMILMEGGSEEQKSDLLPAVAAGEKILTLATNEPNVAYDMTQIELKAEKQGNNFVLNGRKILVPYAEIADILIVAARSSGSPGDHEGISLFLVDRKTVGITYSSMPVIGEEKVYQLDFDGVKIPASKIVGKAGQAIPVLDAALEKTTVIQCAEMVGNAQQELEMTSNYARDRVQFGRPIATFQSVQHRLSDMYVDVQGARWTTYQAAWRLSEKMPAARETAITKIICNRTVQNVAFSAQQLHGGMGVDLDYDLHWYYTRAKALELKHGSSPAQLEKLQAEMGL